MMHGSLIGLIFLQIASTLADFEVGHGKSNFQVTKIEITAKGKEYFSETAKLDSSKRYLTDIALLKPIDDNITIFYAADIESSLWKGGGMRLCYLIPYRFEGTLVRITQHLINTNGMNCPITRLRKPKTESGIELWGAYLPMEPSKKSRYQVSFNLWLMDANVNPLLIIGVTGEM